MMDKSMRSASFTTIALIILLLASIVFIDHPLARYINENYSHADYSRSALSSIELIFGFTISKYLFGFIALLIGGFLYLTNRRSATAIFFLYVGTTHIVTRFVAGVLKNLFLRQRPMDFIASGDISTEFFVQGSSFPSGHAAHFFGLFLPLLFIFPKHKWLLALPVYVAVSRILTNDHYLADILASILIAFVFTWGFGKLFRIKPVM
jgi:membrane-associated phospholipid phosphatase